MDEIVNLSFDEYSKIISKVSKVGLFNYLENMGLTELNSVTKRQEAENGHLCNLRNYLCNND